MIYKLSDEYLTVNRKIKSLNTLKNNQKFPNFMINQNLTRVGRKKLLY